jgi:hypothetical protein
MFVRTTRGSQRVAAVVYDTVKDCGYGLTASRVVPISVANVALVISFVLETDIQAPLGSPPCLCGNEQLRTGL